MLLVSMNGKTVSFRFENIKEGMMQMAKYLVDVKLLLQLDLRK